MYVWVFVAFITDAHTGSILQSHHISPIQDVTDRLIGRSGSSKRVLNVSTVDFPRRVMKKCHVLVTTLVCLHALVTPSSAFTHQVSLWRLQP